MPQKPLRIGVNALYLIPGGVGGTEIYLRNLLDAMAARPGAYEFVVFLNEESGRSIVPARPWVYNIQTGVEATSRPARIIFEQFRLPALCREANIDVLFNPGFTSPVFTSIPSLTAIHDLQHHHHPEYFKPTDLIAWRLLVWASAKHSRQILTISEASREDIHNVYGVPRERIHIAEPGVEPEFFRLNPKGEEPLILCVSTLHPHKNIERLIDAFALFRRNRPEYKLILAGLRGFHADAIERRLHLRGVQQQTTITGWIPREKLIDLYTRARFAVFPSTFEGFGMPVVEAMAAGLPLITSNISPMKDTAGDTALLFPPDSTEALAAAMEHYAADPALRANQAARARQRAQQYTWHRAAARVTEALVTAAGK